MGKKKNMKKAGSQDEQFVWLNKESALLAEVARNRELQERVEEMECFLDEQNQEVEYSEALVRRLVKRIEVFDSKVSVEFKSGLVVDV